MKKIMKIAALAFVLVLGSSLQNKTSAQPYNDRGDVSYQAFYDELSPYGRWIDYPEYGYVWVPNAGGSFRPYSTNGHWVWTDDYEWMWVSDYDWGWAPFHYGRWLEDSFYGWVWVPGYEWSPAWVAWRNGGDYYGWAPLRPGINISINFNIGAYNPPYSYWCFVPRRYIASPRINNYYIDRGRNVTIINQTTIINNYNYTRNVFRTGPRRSEAEIYAGRITPVRFRPANTPGRSQIRNNQVTLYRPNVRQDNNRQMAPRQFERFDRNSVANNNRAGNTNNNNRINRNNTPNSRGNNLPGRNQSIERRDNTSRQPQNNGNNNNTLERRRIERTPGNTQADRTNNSPVVPRTTNGQVRTTGQNNNGRRVFERTTNNGNSNTPARKPQTRPIERQQRQPAQQPRTQQRRQVQQQQQRSQQPRQVERSNNGGNKPQGNNSNSRGGRIKRG